MLVEFLIPILAAVGANVISELAKFIKRSYESYKKLEAASENRFQQALSSDSLVEVGEYFDSTIGKFSVTEYAQNVAIRKRINNFLSRLEDFVGKDEEITKPEKVPERRPEHVPALAAPKLGLVESRIERGYLWDALSTLRRVIELELRSVAQRHEVVIPEKAGAGRILRLLQQRQIIGEDVGEELRYAIDIANRGVHGSYVESAEAFQALEHARNGLARANALQ